ncbi:sulfur carrier protein ThiS [Rhodoferax sp.]|uniref:sulfur carrier protein ThiS n=1 Tax=Rhodoferax sp. TaxID=50421 RepID=UPI002ACE97B7|nr:sulfur carrier protein ThiS [Rhodoferax sp.]MDZ7919404.1 sulfur carrier protein ThiS [Rhodoferax sp.]
MSTTDTAPHTITVVVNGQAESTTARTLQAWVDARGALPAALATAVNGNFVPRSLRAQQPLAEGDTILTFQPIEGG